MAKVTPKDTLKPLNKFEKLAKSLTLASEQEGQSLFDRDVTALEFAHVQDDTDGVKTYVEKMVNIVRNNNLNAQTLQACIPFIQDIARVAQKEDASLSPKEKKRVEVAADKFVGLVRRYTTMRARTSSLLDRVHKRGTAMREKASGALAQSESFVFRMAGKLIASPQPKVDRGAMMRERAAAYRDASDRNKSFLSQSDEPEDISPIRRPKADRGVGLGEGSSSGATGKSMAVFGLMLTELKLIRRLLSVANEDDTLDEEAAARNADNLRVKNGRAPRRSYYEKNGPGAAAPAAGGLLSNLADVGQMMMGAGGLMSVLKMAKPALGLLGKGAAVAGAFLVGWKIGEEIDRWTGASKIVGDAAAYLWAKATGKKTDAEEVAAANRNSRDIAVRNGLSAADAASMPVAEIQKFNMEAAKSKREGKVADVQNGGLPFVAPPSQLPQPITIMPTPSASTALPGASTAAPKAPTSPARVPAPTPAPSQPKAQVKRASKDMKLSDEGLNAIIKREGLPKGESVKGPHKAYLDEGNVWTIGSGLTTWKGKPVTEGLVVSAAEHKAELGKQIREIYEPRTRQRIGDTPVNQKQYDAMVSVVFNGGAISPLLNKLKQGQDPNVDDFLKSATVKGKPNKGLQNRRMSEYTQFASLSDTVPNAVRNAAPLAAASAGARGGNTTIVVAPTSIAQNGKAGNAAAPPAMVVPLRTGNPDATLKSITSVNSI